MGKGKTNINHKLLSPFKGDTAIWVIYVILTVISLIWVYSSIGYSAISDSHTTPWRAFFKHSVFVALSYIVVVAIANMNYRRLSQLSWWGYVLSICLLVVVLLLGRQSVDAGSGMGRWLRIPIIGSFQPSELAKICMVVYLARLLAQHKEEIAEWKTFRNICITMMLVVLLIFPENLSTAVIVFVTCFAMMRFAPVNVSYWRKTLLAIIAAGMIVIFVGSKIGDDKSIVARSTTWTARIDNWLHPDPDIISQENMARMAVASGKLLGNGIGTTIQARLMTQAHNDLIYSIIIEERGMVMGILIFVLYAMLYFRCIKIAWKCKGTFGQLTVAGLGTLIFLQAAIHMAVSVGAMPVTGQTLPLISAGGSSYLCMALAIGIIQSVAADVNLSEAKVKSGKPANHHVESPRIQHNNETKTQNSKTDDEEMLKGKVFADEEQESDTDNIIQE